MRFLVSAWTEWLVGHDEEQGAWSRTYGFLNEQGNENILLLHAFFTTVFSKLRLGSPTDIGDFKHLQHKL